MSRRAGVLLLLLVAAVAAGCERPVEDAAWTRTWRLGGKELDDTRLVPRQSCSEGARDRELLGMLRESRLRICRRACSGAPPDDLSACRVRCDAAVAFVSARCEPRSRLETSGVVR